MELPTLKNLVDLAFPVFIVAVVIVTGFALDLWGQSTRDRKARR